MPREVVESPSLEVFKKTCRYGTPGHDLAAMVVLGWQLYLIILEIFSNLDESIILSFYDTMKLVMPSNNFLYLPW